MSDLSVTQDTVKFYPIMMDILLFIVAIVVTVIIITAIKFIIRKTFLINMENPYLLSCSSEGHHHRVIKNQPIIRSDNERDGIEYTYSIWVWLNDFPKDNTKRYVFLKGTMNKEGKDNKTDIPINASPAMYITTSNKDTNNSAMIVVQQDATNGDQLIAEVPNIPLKKWIHVAIIVLQTKFSVLINGKVSKTVLFQNGSVPEQNNQSIIIAPQNPLITDTQSNMGFDGWVSRFRYFNYAIPNPQLQGILRKGPAKVQQSNPFNEKPKYFLNTFWNS